MNEGLLPPGNYSPDSPDGSGDISDSSLQAPPNPISMPASRMPGFYGARPRPVALPSSDESSGWQQFTDSLPQATWADPLGGYKRTQVVARDEHDRPAAGNALIEQLLILSPDQRARELARRAKDPWVFQGIGQAALQALEASAKITQAGGGQIDPQLEEVAALLRASSIQSAAGRPSTRELLSPAQLQQRLQKLGRRAELEVGQKVHFKGVFRMPEKAPRVKPIFRRVSKVRRLDVSDLSHILDAEGKPAQPTVHLGRGRLMPLDGALRYIDTREQAANTIQQFGPNAHVVWVAPRKFRHAMPATEVTTERLITMEQKGYHAAVRFGNHGRLIDLSLAVTPESATDRHNIREAATEYFRREPRMRQQYQEYQQWLQDAVPHLTAHIALVARSLNNATTHGEQQEAIAALHETFYAIRNPQSNNGGQPLSLDRGLYGRTEQTAELLDQRGVVGAMDNITHEVLDGMHDYIMKACRQGKVPSMRELVTMLPLHFSRERVMGIQAALGETFRTAAETFASRGNYAQVSRLVSMAASAKIISQDQAHAVLMAADNAYLGWAIRQQLERVKPGSPHAYVNYRGRPARSSVFPYGSDIGSSANARAAMQLALDSVIHEQISQEVDTASAQNRPQNARLIRAMINAMHDRGAATALLHAIDNPVAEEDSTA